MQVQVQPPAREQQHQDLVQELLASEQAWNKYRCFETDNSQLDVILSSLSIDKTVVHFCLN